MVISKNSTKNRTPFIWMYVVALLCCGPSLSARAFAATRRFPLAVSRGGSATLFSSGGDDNKVPLTGWNHNPPDPESSFWKKSVNGDGSSNSQSSNNSDDKKELRTGWLHNSKSKEDPQKEEATKGVSLAQLRLQQAMTLQQQNHRIVAPPTFHACGSKQIVVTEHRVSVPIYRQDPKNSPRMDLAFSITEEVKDEAMYKWFLSLQQQSSIMTPQQRATQYVTKAALENADGMMVYLQGGPGFASPTPVVGLGFSQDASWAAKALGDYQRIVLMDQRGTGKSTPITKQTLEKRFPNLFSSSMEELKTSKKPEDYEKFQLALTEATNYMAQMRADSIVRDAEAVKDIILLPGEPGKKEPGPRPWGCALGQSFGGFSMMTYLSLIEHPPRVCLFTGGIAPMLTPAYEAYSSLWERVRERSLRFYDMYPGDIPVVKKIVKKLLEEPVTLPSGGTLTARRFLQLGMGLGGPPSSFASLHSLFNSAFLHDDDTEFRKTFLKAVDSDQPFDDNPIYYWLHESIYADGPKNSPTNWAAHRAYEDKVKTPSEFDYRLTSQLDSDSRPTLFSGEMVFPWMAEDFAECGGIGCTALANALASKEDWGPLYDVEHMRRVLSDGTSRAAAAVYYDDMYVDFDCCMKVTARGGPLEKCKVSITNDYQHSGLRDDGAKIYSKLHGMATGSVRTPS